VQVIAAPDPVPGPSPLSAGDLERRNRAIALLDDGRFEDAERILGDLMEKNPTNAANSALHEAALLGLRKARLNATTDLSNKPIIALGVPPFAYTFIAPVASGGRVPKLKKLSEKKNQITDEAKWLANNGLAMPTVEPTTEGPFPRALGTEPLNEAILHADHTALIFGQGRSGRMLALLDKTGRPPVIFDFRAFNVPNVQEQIPGLTTQAVTWAQRKGDVVFVSNAHRGYAKDSGGRNAYVSALDATTGALRWRSQPLVANAANFVLHGGAIICGYGFTAEPDFLFVLDQATGKVVERIPVASGPEMILEKNGKLFVRTYDTDYVFSFDDVAPTVDPLGTTR
jgi:hypothetical protein